MTSVLGTAQLVLLVTFAAAIAISFIMRLRMGAIMGSIARGEEPKDAQPTAHRYYLYAKRSAIIGAISLVLCILVGVISSSLV